MFTCVIEVNILLNLLILLCTTHVSSISICFFKATLGNIRELKLAMDNFETMEIANFSAALTRAFELLEIYRNNSGGANCNQVLEDYY